MLGNSSEKVRLHDEVDICGLACVTRVIIQTLHAKHAQKTNLLVQV